MAGPSAAAVWSPHLQYHIHQLEKVQRSAARFVMNDYARYSSVTNMLNYLSWPTLEQRRNQIKPLVLFFKIVHDIVDGSTLILTPLNTITRGHHFRYALPFSSYLNSFLPLTIRLWNKLPAILSEIGKINDFKKDDSKAYNKNTFITTQHIIVRVKMSNFTYIINPPPPPPISLL